VWGYDFLANVYRCDKCGEPMPAEMEAAIQIVKS
jgi:hypothetical protein